MLAIALSILQAILQVRFWLLSMILSLGLCIYVERAPESTKAYVRELVIQYIDSRLSKMKPTDPSYAELASFKNACEEFLRIDAAPSPSGDSEDNKDSWIPNIAIPGFSALWNKRIQAVVFAMGLSACIIALLPKRPSKEEAIQNSTVHVLRQAHSVAPEKIIAAQDDYYQLSIRAAAARGMIIYAVGSFLATVFFPPASTGEGAEDKTMMHFAALIIVTALSAAYSVQRPALRHTNSGALSIAFRVGLAAIFFGGAIALLISLPYRMLTSVPESKLGDGALHLIIGIRIIALPVIGFIAALITVMTVRAYNRNALRASY